MQDTERTLGDGLKFLQTINVPFKPGNHMQTVEMSVLPKGKEKWDKFQLEARVSELLLCVGN